MEFPANYTQTIGSEHIQNLGESLIGGTHADNDQENTGEPSGLPQLCVRPSPKGKNKTLQIDLAGH